MLAARHRLNGDRSVQKQWQSNNHRLNFWIVQQSLHAAVGLIVNFDFFPSLIFGGIAVLLDQTGSSGQRSVAGPVAVKRAVDTAGADISDRFDLDILRSAATDEHVAFVADAVGAVTSLVDRGRRPAG